MRAAVEWVRCTWWKAVEPIPVLRLLSSYLVTTDQSTRAMSTFAPYDQYEVSVPLAAAGDCLALVSLTGAEICMCRRIV